jgi:PAS domain S-box-containing protein
MGKIQEASQRILEVLISQNKELICIHKPDGIFEHVSESSLIILGYTPDEMIGKSPYDFIHKEDQLRTRVEVHNTALQGEMDSMTTLRYRHKAGHYIYLQTISQPVFDEKGEVKNLYSSSRDITEQLSQAEELKRISRLFEDASSLAGVGAWEYNPATGEIFWTKEMFKIHELEYGAVPSLEEGMKHFPGDAKDKILEAIDEGVKNGEPYLLELPFITKKGNHRWVRALGRPLFKDGEFVQLYGAFQDITDIKTKELELTGRNKELKSLISSLSIKNEQLHDFSQIIAHNMRAPVGNLKILSEFLQRTDDPKEAHHLADQINSSVEMLNATFEEVMEVLKVKTVQVLKTKKVKVRSTIEDIIELFTGDTNRLNATVNIELDAFDGLKTSSVYFKSIMTNLISNAFKYNNPEVPLILTIKNGYSKTGKPFISIKDNGLGIDLERHGKKLFKLHKVFHRNPDARGFGLFMTKNQVEALGGEIVAESKPFKGTCFTVYFKKGNASKDS